MLNCKIILNPTSGQGVGGSLKTRILSSLNLKEEDIAVTQSLKHASELARDFAKRGFKWGSGSFKFCKNWFYPCRHEQCLCKLRGNSSGF